MTQTAKLRFVTLDVFTIQKYAGNPLAVVLVPRELAGRVQDQQKRQIAYEFNLSETVFLQEDQGSGVFKVSIWVPEKRELPFAGHPTVGTAFYLFQSKGLSRLTLDIPAGKTPARLVDGRALINVPVDAKQLSPSLPLDTLRRVCPSFPSSNEHCLFSIVKDMTFALCPLPTLEALADVRLQTQEPSFDLGQLTEAEKPWNTTGFFFYYFYTILPEQSGAGTVVRTRMIGHIEDPATGSAASALASFLTLQDAAESCQRSFHLQQGIEMGRPSDIYLTVTKTNGAIAAVELAGRAVQVQEGQIEIDC